MRPLVNYLKERCSKQADQRFLVGIVGVPGAGKSTLAQRLVDAVNQEYEQPVAVCVPMDGYHLPNSVLDARNLRVLKGVAETFDGEGFVSLLGKLRQDDGSSVVCPTFDRSIDASVEDGLVVESGHRIIVIEGNYLLLPRHPWDRIPSLLNEIWYLDVDEQIIKPRLLDRHILGGRSAQDAQQKMDSTDLPNARLIKECRTLADKIVLQMGEGYVISALNSAVSGETT